MGDWQMESITKERVSELVSKQREYFKTGETLDIDFRIKQLRKLKSMVESHEKEMETHENG